MGNSTISVGDTVQPQAGVCAEDDMETGVVESIDGDVARVAWESGVVTPYDLDSLEVV